MFPEFVPLRIRLSQQISARAQGLSASRRLPRSSKLIRGFELRGWDLSLGLSLQLALYSIRRAIALQIKALNPSVYTRNEEPPQILTTHLQQPSLQDERQFIPEASFSHCVIQPEALVHNSDVLYSTVILSWTNA
jgi:hypothetical protein